MLKVYGGFKSWTRDCRPRWILDELGIKYETVQLDVFKGEHKSPDYLKLHPLGKVPYVSDGEVGIFESGAISLYLADRYGADQLVPPSGTEARAKYYQWMLFIPLNVETPIVKIFVNRYLFPNQEEAIAGENELAPIASFLESVLREKKYLVGDQFTAADIMLGSTLLWADKAQALGKYPVLKQYLSRLAERPAYKKMIAPTEKEYFGYAGPTSRKEEGQ
jgi:glutathione S-transferase